MAELVVLLAAAALFAILSQTKAVCSSHKKCGCYHGWCWAYQSWEAMKGGDDWCFTQRLGVANGKKSFASCAADDDCNMEMTCGDNISHKGDDGGRPVFDDFPGCTNKNEKINAGPPSDTANNEWSYTCLNLEKNVCGDYTSTIMNDGQICTACLDNFGHCYTGDIKGVTAEFVDPEDKKHHTVVCINVTIWKTKNEHRLGADPGAIVKIKNFYNPPRSHH